MTAAKRRFAAAWAGGQAAKARVPQRRAAARCASRRSCEALEQCARRRRRRARIRSPRPRAAEHRLSLHLLELRHASDWGRSLMADSLSFLRAALLPKS